MIPLVENPTVIIVMDEEDMITKVITNISPNVKIKTVYKNSGDIPSLPYELEESD